VRTALVFGYGQKTDGEINEQTRDRCNKAISLYHEKRIGKVYLTVSAVKNGVSMANEMKKYIILGGVNEKDILTDPRGRNTAGEMDVFFQLIPNTSMIIFISTWYHIPRIIWLSLWRLPPRKSLLLWFKVGIAWKHTHFKGDFLKEFLKIANAMMRPYKSAKMITQAIVLK